MLLERSFQGLRDAEIGSDGRTLVLACVPFSQPSLVDDGAGPYREEFRHGAFSHITRAANRTELRYGHRQDGLPYGYGLDLIEDPSHLIGRFRVAPSEQGDQMLALVRDDQLRGVSIGFVAGEDEETVSAGMRHVVRTRVKRLPEVSLVVVGSFDSAQVLAIRSQEMQTHDLGAVERERLYWARMRVNLR